MEEHLEIPWVHHALLLERNVKVEGTEATNILSIWFEQQG